MNYNYRELKELNDKSLALMQEYKAKCKDPEQQTRALECFNRAVIKFDEVKKNKEMFDINALSLAKNIQQALREKGMQYEIGIELNNTTKNTRTDEFGTMETEFYDYSLVLYHPYAVETIAIANDTSSIMANNPKYLGFDKASALENFEHKTINLLKSGAIYIQNLDVDTPCATVKKFDLESAIWQALENEHESKFAPQTQNVEAVAER